MVQEVELDEESVVFLQILLPPISTVLSELLVPGVSEGQSDFSATAADLLARRIPGILGPPRLPGETDRGPMRLRGTGTFNQDGEPIVYLDGVQVSPSTAYEVLSRIPAESVEAIELLRGPAASFLHPFGANGVIHVRTK